MLNRLSHQGAPVALKFKEDLNGDFANEIVDHLVIFIKETTVRIATGTFAICAGTSVHGLHSRKGFWFFSNCFFFEREQVCVPGRGAKGERVLSRLLAQLGA